MDEEKSMFLQFFGDSPNFRMMDFLLEHRLEDFTKTDIAKGANISWASLFNHWEVLETHGVVKPTRTVGRATLYQLNEASPIVKQLKMIEQALMRQAAEEEEGRMAIRARAKKN
jgi:predicted transcriptional regulator